MEGAGCICPDYLRINSFNASATIFFIYVYRRRNKSIPMGYHQTNNCLQNSSSDNMGACSWIDITITIIIHVTLWHMTICVDHIKSWQCDRCTACPQSRGFEVLVYGCRGFNPVLCCHSSSKLPWCWPRSQVPQCWLCFSVIYLPQCRKYKSSVT